MSVVARQGASPRVGGTTAGAEAPGSLLLTTKLRRPSASATMVTRPRLLERLDGALRCRLTLVAAPPGFGKTTLLSTWTLQSGRPTGWVSLDSGDNDPVRFWSYVLTALERLCPGAGESALALLQAPSPPPIATVLTLASNALAESAGDLLLVLDDYHAVDAQEIHDGVAFLLDRFPPHVHLIVATRADPPLPLARLRARGHLLEVRAAELRFQPDEAVAFLNDAMGLGLSPPQVGQLAERTEGWIAGLQLAALSLQSRDDPSGLLGTLSGAHRFILDYLADEVLAHQSQEARSFLLQTAVLDRFNGPLCDAVTGSATGQAMLESLERANLFVVPLDDERHWYRYHHLFADFLLSRLRQEEGELIATLHRRAGRWYAAAGLADEAIGHALAAGDAAWGAELIEGVAQTYLMRGEVTTLRRWLDLLPVAVIRASPRLCLNEAWMQLFTLSIEGVERHARDAEQAIALLPDQERQGFLGELATLRMAMAAIHAASGQVVTRPDLRAVLGGLDDNPFLRGIGALVLGIDHEFTGNVSAAVDAYRQATLSSAETGNVIVSLFALSQLADQYVVQGRLHKAAEAHRQALRLAGGRSAIPLDALPHFGLAMVAYEWDDLATAREHLDAALTIDQQLGTALLGAAGCVLQARLRQAEGDGPGALEALRQADLSLAGSEMEEFLSSFIAALRARLCIRNGDLAAAEDWAARYARLAAGPGGRRPAQIDVLEQGSLLRVLIAQGRPRDALERAAALGKRARAAGQTGSLVEYLFLAALAHEAAGERDPALVALARSLALAAPEGYVRLYADEGEPAAALLAHLARAGAAGAAGLPAVPAAYLQRVMAARGLAALPSRPRGTQPDAASPPLVEPLSEREIEVLRLVAAGLSNQEIARTLVVEVSTVKTHLLRLYGKLGIHSRTQAVSRAQELKLL